MTRYTNLPQVAQDQHGALFPRQRRQLLPQLAEGVAVAVGALGHVVRELLPPPPAPPADVLAGHGGANVRLGAVLVADTVPGVAQPEQRLLHQIGRVVGVAAEHVAVSEQRGTPGSDEILELHIPETSERGDLLRRSLLESIAYLFESALQFWVPNRTEVRPGERGCVR
ncbi:hypothetical protein GCM10012289_58730 [Nonomuraea cavernae]|uniref:Uncharacterized protein n=1 Tax=Nonomuraea cavernae TaxID=2045107 RepID=A0A917Z9N9_9ACTN|nr:hypothetical protein GCM10012289_58730 [Nonomuraea cavernae]